MKNIRQLTDFTCDQCSAKIKDCPGFPYDKGWHYLYNLDFKTMTLEGVKNFKLLDKHFCSAECVKSFIGEALIGKGGKDELQTA